MPLSAEERDALIRVAASLPRGVMERRIILSSWVLQPFYEAKFKSIVDIWKNVVVDLPSKVVPSLSRFDTREANIRFEIGLGLPRTSSLYGGGVDISFELLEDGQIRIASSISIPKLSNAERSNLLRDLKSPIMNGGIVSSDERSLRDSSSSWLHDVQEALKPYGKSTSGVGFDVAMVLGNDIMRMLERMMKPSLVAVRPGSNGHESKVISAVPVSIHKSIKVVVELEHGSDETLTVNGRVIQLSPAQIEALLESNLVSGKMKEPMLGTAVKFKTHTSENLNVDTMHLDDSLDVVESWFKAIKKVLDS